MSEDSLAIKRGRRNLLLRAPAALIGLSLLAVAGVLLVPGALLWWAGIIWIDWFTGGRD